MAQRSERDHRAARLIVRVESIVESIKKSGTDKLVGGPACMMLLHLCVPPALHTTCITGLSILRAKLAPESQPHRANSDSGSRMVLGARRADDLTPASVTCAGATPPHGWHNVCWCNPTSWMAQRVLVQPHLMDGTTYAGATPPHGCHNVCHDKKRVP